MMRAAVGIALGLLAIGCGRDAPVTDETRARERYVLELAVREGLVDAWSLASRSDLQFEDGFAPVELVDPLARAAWWDERARTYSTGRAQPVRWMGARGHLRVRGKGDHRLEIRGWADVTGLRTRPVVSASIDGMEFHSTLVDDAGYFLIDATIPGSRLTGWSDIYLTMSSIDNQFQDPSGKLSTTRLTVVRVERVTWAAVDSSARPTSLPGAP
jgi:hypothetical protein